MEKRARIVLYLTAILLSVMLIFSIMDRGPEAVKIKTANATVQDIYNSVTAPGTIEAAESTSICPLETAEVTETCVTEGDVVEAGDVLCILSPLKGYAVDAGDLKKVLQAVSKAEGGMVTAADAFTLCSPCSGEVLELPEKGDTVFEGLPCVRVADLSVLQIRVKAPELYAGELEEGQPANVTATASGDKRFAAEVKSIAPAAVRTSGLTGGSVSATVEAVLPLSGDVSELRPGYTASAKIFTEHHQNAVVVPFEAVCQRGEQEYVFTVENSHAVLKEVETGYMLERVTEIEDGLNGGETVILSPSDDLSDGALVEVAE